MICDCITSDENSFRRVVEYKLVNYLLLFVVAIVLLTEMEKLLLSVMVILVMATVF